MWWSELMRWMAEAGIGTPVGSVWDSCDTAPAETIIGLFKTEVIKFLGPWKSVGQVEWETLKWGDCYNNTHPHSAIGDVAPQEAEEAFHAGLNAVRKAAQSSNQKPSCEHGAVHFFTNQFTVPIGSIVAKD
ncbi:integrase core domain-containing protein [Fluviibacterium sp. DFM31]|uniref:Integrase core domain-containing protein n=1 Tax=Meridianimarinicoccus marinus TaxID=3231483 RepID=A0ABV3L1N8_9RHOB